MSELGPDAKSLLDAASGGDEPSVADRARVRAALGARLAITAAAAGVALTAVSSAAASASSAGTAVGTTAAGAGVGVAGASGAAGASVAGAATIAAPLGIGMKLLLAFGAATAVGVGAVSYVESTPPAPTVIAAPPSVVAPRDPSRVAPIAPPSALPVAPASAAPAASTASASASVSALASNAPPSAPAAPAVSTASTDAIDRELGLIREAQLALQSGNGARALVLLDEHARRFPAGSLGEEREAARVFALCSLGRTSEARAAADRFLAAFPRSPQAARVRSSCGGATF